MDKDKGFFKYLNWRSVNSIKTLTVFLTISGVCLFSSPKSLAALKSNNSENALTKIKATVEKNSDASATNPGTNLNELLNLKNLKSGFPSKNQLSEFIESYSLTKDSVTHLEQAMNDLPELPIKTGAKKKFITNFNGFLETGNLWISRNELGKAIESTESKSVWKEKLLGLHSVLKFSTDKNHFRHVLSLRPYGKVELTLEIKELKKLKKFIKELSKKDSDLSQFKITQKNQLLTISEDKPLAVIRLNYLPAGEKESAFEFNKGSLQQLIFIRRFQAFVTEDLDQEFMTNSSLNPQADREIFREKSELMRISDFLGKIDQFIAQKILISSKDSQKEVSEFLDSMEEFEIKRKSHGPYWSINPNDYFETHQASETAFRNTLSGSLSKKDLWKL